MRLLSLVRSKLVNLSMLQIAVLDEADKLLEVDHYRDEMKEEIEEENGNDGDDSDCSDSSHINKKSSFFFVF